MISPTWQSDDGSVRLYCGDTLSVLPQLPAESVQCVVTSPPYFALRSYLPKDHPNKPLEIGSEPTPEAFIATMVAVFREVRRVLRDDGVCWINLGTTYASGDKRPIPSRQPADVLPCGTGGTECQDSQDGGPACPDSCGEPQGETLTHRGRTARNDQSGSQDEPPLSPTGRDTERSGFQSSPASLDAWLPAAPVSTMPSSVLSGPAACGREGPASACPSSRPTSSPELHPSSDTAASLCDPPTSALGLLGKGSNTCGNISTAGASARRILGTASGSSALFGSPSLMSLYSSIERRQLQDGNDLMIPALFALAMQADGWIIRQVIIWQKASPMPESVSGWKWQRCRVKIKSQDYSEYTQPGKVSSGEISGGHRNRDAVGGEWIGGARWTDCPGCAKCAPHGGYVLQRGAGRCTTAHEYVFLMTKSRRYFWDGEGCKERGLNTCTGRTRGAKGEHAAGGEVRSNGSFRAEGLTTHRNPRSVWRLSSEPTSERHFAAFPSELVRRCLVAGVSAGGCCPKCGAPWAPVVDSQRVPTRPGTGSKIAGTGAAEHGNRDAQRHVAVSQCSGYRPTCDCGESTSIGCMVMDPFSGIGTVAQTARELGCRAIGIDLNPHYHEIAVTRVMKRPRWKLRQLAARRIKPDAAREQPSLFALQGTP